jgi:aspartokinase
MKFGGTSVGSAQAMRETADLIQHCLAEWGQVVVVASAMGTKPVKVTDLLLQGANTAAAAMGHHLPPDGRRSCARFTIKRLTTCWPTARTAAVTAEIERFIDRFEICAGRC